MKQEPLQHPDTTFSPTPTQQGGGEVVVPLHPYQVLRRLPKDATPAQQDSAIQATFQPRQIRYSNRPDTLHLPGHPIGKSIKEVSVPQYYNETYFKNNNLYRPEVAGGRMGVAGDPRPYQTSTDNLFSSIIITCILATILIISYMRHFFLIETKEFFAPARKEELKQKETSIEYIFQIILSLQAYFVIALVFFDYTQTHISQTFTVETEYQVIAIFLAEAMACYIGKVTIQQWANKTLFPNCDIHNWNQSRLFINSLIGIAFLPILLLNVYFDLNIEMTASYMLTVMLIAEILLFFKADRIFFNKTTLKLHIFLYLCTLEIIPILLLGAILLQTAYNLTIIY